MTKDFCPQRDQNAAHNVRHSSTWLPILPRFGRKVAVSFWSRSCGSSPLWAEKPIVVPTTIDAISANKIVIRMQWYFLLRLRNCCQHDVFSDVWSSRFKEISELNCKDSAYALAECIGSIVSSEKITKIYFVGTRNWVQTSDFRAKNICKNLLILPPS